MASEERQVTSKRSEYKGNAMLVLTTGEGDRFPFQFGLTKAKRIVACLEDIKKFVEEESAKKASTVKVQ